MSILDNAVISLAILATTIRRASLARSRRSEPCTAPKSWLSFRSPDWWLKGDDALALCGSQGLAGLYKSHRSTLTLTAAPGRGSHARQSLWFEERHSLINQQGVERGLCHARQNVRFSIPEMVRLVWIPISANVAATVSSGPGSRSALRGTLVSSKNQPNRPCRRTRHTAGISVFSQK